MEFVATSVVLLCDLPPSALVGVDLLSFTTTPRFRGVKNVPAGLHFVFASPSTSFSERHGLWLAISDATKLIETNLSLTVTKWNAATESLSLNTNDHEVLSWQANLGSIWHQGLTPYRQSATTDVSDDLAGEEAGGWFALTSNITHQLLNRITGNTDGNWRLSSASSSKRDVEQIPGLTSQDVALQSEEELTFLPIDLKRTWRAGATGRERTTAAQDRTWALGDVVTNFCTDGNAREVVGEMQFCFLMVLTINNFSCLEQWKRILTLVFTCRDAVLARPELFVSAIATLRLQLQHCKDAEAGLIDLADEGGSLLKGLLVRFRKGLDGLSTTGVQDVVDELDDLEDYLRQEHGWQFGGAFAKAGMLELEDVEQVRMDTTAFDEDDETGEFAPQIVELTAEQARMLNVEDEEELHATLSRASLRDVEGKRHQDRGGSEVDETSDIEEMDDGELEDMDARY